MNLKHFFFFFRFYFFVLPNFKGVKTAALKCRITVRTKPYVAETEIDNTSALFDIQALFTVGVCKSKYDEIYWYVYDLFSAPQRVNYDRRGNKMKTRAGPECLVKHYVKTLTRKWNVQHQSAYEDRDQTSLHTPASGSAWTASLFSPLLLLLSLLSSPFLSPFSYSSSTLSPSLFFRALRHSCRPTCFISSCFPSWWHGAMLSPKVSSSSWD